MLYQTIVLSSSSIPKLTGPTLLTACPIMIHNYGLGFYLEVWRHAQKLYPQFQIKLSIPSGENVGLALRSILAGVSQICLYPACESYDQVNKFAAHYGVGVFPQEELNDQMA